MTERLPIANLADVEAIEKQPWQIRLAHETVFHAAARATVSLVQCCKRDSPHPVLPPCQVVPH